MAPNFPAIDVIFRVGNVVIAFQTHISGDHRDVLPLLNLRVENSKWQDDGIHIFILVYLTPMAPKQRRWTREHEQASETSADSEPFAYLPFHFTV